MEKIVRYYSRMHDTHILLQKQFFLSASIRPPCQTRHKEASNCDLLRPLSFATSAVTSSFERFLRSLTLFLDCTQFRHRDWSERTTNRVNSCEHCLEGHAIPFSCYRCVTQFTVQPIKGGGKLTHRCKMSLNIFKADDGFSTTPLQEPPKASGIKLSTNVLRQSLEHVPQFLIGPAKPVGHRQKYGIQPVPSSRPLNRDKSMSGVWNVPSEKRHQVRRSFKDA
jgi:hypothetical protein